jgi:hypothetical protein
MADDTSNCTFRYRYQCRMLRRGSGRDQERLRLSTFPHILLHLRKSPPLGALPQLLGDFPWCWAIGG